MLKTEHTTPLLRMLHWLPISSRIAYKIDSICHTSLTTAYPKYLSELLTVYTSARPLHSSSDLNILNVATTRIKSVSEHLHTREQATGTEPLVNSEGLRTCLPYRKS